MLSPPTHDYFSCWCSDFLFTKLLHHICKKQVVNGGAPDTRAFSFLHFLVPAVWRHNSDPRFGRPEKTWKVSIGGTVTLHQDCLGLGLDTSLSPHASMVGTYRANITFFTCIGIRLLYIKVYIWTKTVSYLKGNFENKVIGKMSCITAL